MSELNRLTLKLLNRENLSAEDIARSMQIMTLGGATPAQSSAFLTALRMKGYNSDEIAGALSFFSSKQRLAYEQPAVFLSLRKKHADSWIGAGLILASLNIPCYLQFERTDEMHVAQQINVDLEMDNGTSLECLNEAHLCIAFQKKPKAFRNIIDFLQELDFLTLIEITMPCASLVNPLAIVYEQRDHTDAKTYINAIHRTGCQAATVVVENGSALRLLEHKLFEVTDLNAFLEPHKIGESEKAGRLRAFTHKAETLNFHDIIRKAAEVLLLTKAAASVEDGVRIATAAYHERALDKVLDKLVHISNSMEEDDSAENEE